MMTPNEQIVYQMHTETEATCKRTGMTPLHMYRIEQIRYCSDAVQDVIVHEIEEALSCLHGQQTKLRYPFLISLLDSILSGI